MKKMAAKIFAVVAILMAMCTSASATGPYLGTAYKVEVFKGGTEVIEISGEESDVMVELMRLKYDYIKQGKLQSTYFYTEGDNAIAKLLVVPKPERGLLRVYEFCGTQDKALDKVSFSESAGYKIVIFDDSNLCRTTVVAEKIL